MMHVTAAELDGDPAYRDGQWIVTARVTIRMTDAEHQQMDGLRLEAFPWIRFRLRLYKDPQGPGAWCYEVRDSQRSTDEDPVVRSGTRLHWKTALAAGQCALLDSRHAAQDEDETAGVAPAGTEVCQ